MKRFGAVIFGLFCCVNFIVAQSGDTKVNVYFINNGPFGNGNTELSVFIDGRKVKNNLDSREDSDFKIKQGAHTILVEAHHNNTGLATVSETEFVADNATVRFWATLSSTLLPGQRASNSHPERYSFSLTLELVGGGASVNSGTPSNSGSATAQRPIGQSTLEAALYTAADIIIKQLPPRTTVAVISIASRDIDSAEFALDELAYVIVNSGSFKVVDRKSLDAIKSEQNFQLGGDVDDNSAVSIGKLLGANIVITGSISGVGSTRRLRLKALDVETAEIVSMASEAY